MEGITPVMNVGTPAATNSDGWGGGCGAWLMWVIVIFAMMGGGGWGALEIAPDSHRQRCRQVLITKMKWDSSAGFPTDLRIQHFLSTPPCSRVRQGLRKRSCRATIRSEVSLLRTASRSNSVAAKPTAISIACGQKTTETHAS